MNNNFANPLRLWTVGLALASVLAGFLIGSLNAANISLVYMVLFLAVVATGLFANLWGGFAASVIAVFALILLNQFVGIYPSQNGWVNIASELAVFLVAGPLAGGLARFIEGGQLQAARWASLAEGRLIHDESFQTLKPQWALTRLEEEMLRARQYARPLAIGLMQWMPAENLGAKERLAGLQALIRIARSATNASDVVAYHGDNRVLVLIPERTVEQAQKILAHIEQRAAQEMAIPEEADGLSAPLAKPGNIIFVTSAPGADARDANALLRTATTALEAKLESIHV